MEQTVAQILAWHTVIFSLFKRKEKRKIDRKMIEKEAKQMLIGCTKNLLEFLKETPAEREEAIDPLYSWTANLIILNRRKTLVAVNDATKCCFVLYGLTTKMIPKLPELLKNGIRAALESEYIAPNIIDKYLDECGQNLIFTKTLRSEVAYCNKACERVKRFSEILTPTICCRSCFCRGSMTI